MTARPPGWRLWPLALACMVLPRPAPALAAEWSAQGGLQARLRVTQDRPDHGDVPATVTRESRVSGSANALRSLETGSTRLDVSLDLPATGLKAGRNVLGRVALGQTLSAPLDSFSADLDLSVDDNQGTRRSATDELLGRRRRTSAASSVSWQHQFSERIATQASFSQTQTRFGSGAATAEAFHDAQWATSASYRWDELLRLSLQVSHSRFNTEIGDNDSTSDSISLSASRALTEASSLSASLGANRSLRTTTLRGFACPLPVSFCQAGLVAPVAVSQRLQTPSRGAQYSLSYQSSLSERTGLAVTASRQLSATGLGLVQSDSASASLNHAVTPELSWALSGTRSQSRTPGASNAAEPRVNALEGSLSWALAERLSLAATATTRRFREPVSGTASTSTQISISLQYQGPKILATR